MLFNKNDKQTYDRVIYTAKPNMLFGCKKAIYGVVLLLIILSISPMAIKFIGQMQVYLISQIKLPLTRYTAVGFFVIILINVIYIIWQLVGWSSIEYTLTESKIIIKSGVISTKKNYMPYATIQDINTSQSIFARLFNVGTVSAFSAYDNNQLELKNISNPSEAEEIIFSRMTQSRSFQAPPQAMPQYGQGAYNEYSPREEIFERSESYARDDYLGRNEYYDEYEPITPITHERNFSPRRDYEYYPEDFDDFSSGPRHTYEYEPFDNGYGKPQNSLHRNNRYNEMTGEYLPRNQGQYHNNQPQNQYNERVEEYPQNNQQDIDDTSEKVIQRHFDKFKK